MATGEINPKWDVGQANKVAQEVGCDVLGCQKTAKFACIAGQYCEEHIGAYNGTAQIQLDPPPTDVTKWCDKCDCPSRFGALDICVQCGTKWVETERIVVDNRLVCTNCRHKFGLAGGRFVTPGSICAICHNGGEYAENASKPDMINAPPHYQSKTGLEAIDVIEAFELDYYQACAVKYILRAGKKTGDVEADLKKAIWYLNRKIQHERIPPVKWMNTNL